MKTLANYSRKMLERRIRLLVVALNMLLEGSQLPEVLKKELGKTHECLIENITKMPLSIMREFVHRMHGYFLSLYDVIKDNDFGHLPNVPTIPISEPKQTVEKKTQPPKHTPKRKRGRPKKPKLPYQRYHFPIAVDGLTTFDSLDNTNRDGSDDDLVEESMVMSLLDPISGHRLITPLRTRFCSHLQCFDMESFLELNNLRPFKVGIRRERPLPNGKPNVAAIFRDTQRRPLNPEIHNKMTPDFGYKTRYKHNLEQRKYNNNLLFFKCPICRLEFNIKDPGDVYVVGDLVDLLFDLDQTGHGNVEKVRISKDGTWSPIIEEETKEIEESKVVEIDLDDMTSEEEVTVKKEGEVNDKDETNEVNDKDETTENNGEKVSEKEETTENHADKTIEENANETSSDTDVEVNDAEETDNWSDESRELDRAMDTALGPDDPYRGYFAQQMGIPVRVGIQQQKRYVTPPPPPSVYPPAQRIRLRDILMHQSQDAYYGNGRWNSQPSKMYEGQLHQQNLRRSATYGPPRNDHQNDGPVFFTGNGEEDDPFVID